MGPLKQLKKMFEPTRLLATLVMLVIATVPFAFQTANINFPFGLSVEILVRSLSVLENLFSFNSLSVCVYSDQIIIWLACV